MTTSSVHWLKPCLIECRMQLVHQKLRKASHRHKRWLLARIVSQEGYDELMEYMDNGFQYLFV